MTVLELSFKFALKIIALYKNLIQNNEYVLSKQILRSWTSIWANIEEANAWQSKKDFLTKMSIASKEARETKYRLRLLNDSNILNTSEYLKDIDHIINMLTKIVKTTGENIKNKK